MDEKWITVKEAAIIRKCTERNIIELIKKGILQSKKDGRKWLVLVEASETNAELSPQFSEIISVLKVQLEGKDKQIEEKDKQIERLQEQLSDASQRHDTIIMQLTRQLEQSQRMLEAHRDPWYRRWFRKSQQSQNR